MKPYSDIDPEAPRSVWEKRIPQNMISLICGAGGAGKSTLMAHLAVDVASRGHGVILSSVESRPKFQVRPRLDAALMQAGQPKSLLKRIYEESKWRFPESLDELEKQIIRTNCKLVIIDPVASHLGRRVSRHDDSIREISNPLTEIADRCECAIVLFEHPIKYPAPRSPILNLVGGNSSGLALAAQIVFLIGKDPEEDDRHVVVTIKDNVFDWPDPIAFDRDQISFVDKNGVEGTAPFFKVLGETTFDDPRALVQDAKSTSPGQAPDKLAAACAWLTEYLSAADEDGYKRDSGEIKEDARRVEIKQRTLRRAKDQMKLIIEKQGPHKTFWGLPQELIDSLKAAESNEDQASPDDVNYWTAEFDVDDDDGDDQ